MKVDKLIYGVLVFIQLAIISGVFVLIKIANNLDTIIALIKAGL